MKTTLHSLLASLVIVAAPALATAQTSAPRPAEAQYNLSKGLALSGYDPVAYFEVGGGKPREGKKSFAAKHGGVTYRFSSEANRATFLATPERFEPAYGGWCAYAMASGEKVEIDPDRFLIENGKLHVFYDGFFGPNTRKKWLKEGGDTLSPKASAAWQTLSGEVTQDLRHYNLDQGVGLAGYDPVSYFAEGGGKPAKGAAKWSARHGGVGYQFTSEKNRDLFLAGPDRFVPKFGGYCAWAMSQGKKVEVDPNAFTLTGGQLHLFYNADKRDAWTAELDKLQPAAEREWKALHPQA